MSVPDPPAAKHHVAAGYGAFMHLPQMNRGEMFLECALVAEGFHADVALDPFLPCGRAHVGDTES